MRPQRPIFFTHPSKGLGSLFKSADFDRSAILMNIVTPTAAFRDVCHDNQRKELSSFLSHRHRVGSSVLGDGPRGLPWSRTLGTASHLVRARVSVRLRIFSDPI